MRITLRFVRIAFVLSAGAGACSGGGDSAANAIEAALREGTCNDCRVVADTVAFLGHADDTVAFRIDVLPARDSRGRFYLPDRTGSMVYVFGPSGRLTSAFGKRGRGPGELSGVRAIYVTAGDSLLVVGAGVVHVFTPEYAHAREYRNMGGSPDEFASTILSGGRILIDRPNHSFTLVDTTGNIASTIKLQNIGTTRCGECGERVYREARDPGSVWSSPLNRYRIERHDLAGALMRRFTRNPSWFSDWTASDIVARDIVTELGRPRVIGARQDSDGIVWVHVSLIEHRDGLGQVDEDVPRQMVRVWGSVVTHVDALDTEKGELLASAKVPNMVFALVRDYAAQLLVNEEGDWTWNILKFKVERPAR